MKFLKIKSLLLALLAVVFWSCSQDDIITTEDPGSVIDESVIDQMAADYDYSREPDIVITEEELDRLDIDLSQYSDNQNTSRNNYIPNWAWWIHDWERSGGHMLERHWSKSVAYLRARPIAQATTFDPGAISPVEFSNMMKYIADNYWHHAKDIPLGHTLGISFSRAPGFNKVIGWGFADGKGTVYATKRFTIVFKRLRYAAGVYAAGAVIVLTGYPVL